MPYVCMKRNRHLPTQSCTSAFIIQILQVFFSTMVLLASKILEQQRRIIGLRGRILGKDLEDVLGGSQESGKKDFKILKLRFSLTMF